MIKGVNHQMIEITACDSPYFERALLVLRPDCADAGDAHLQEEARRLLKATGGYSALYKNRRRARRLRCLWIALGIIVGLLIGLTLARLGL